MTEHELPHPLKLPHTKLPFQDICLEWLGVAESDLIVTL